MLSGIAAVRWERAAGRSVAEGCLGSKWDWTAQHISVAEVSRWTGADLSKLDTVSATSYNMSHCGPDNLHLELLDLQSSREAIDMLLEVRYEPVQG